MFQFAKKCPKLKVIKWTPVGEVLWTWTIKRSPTGKIVGMAERSEVKFIGNPKDKEEVSQGIYSRSRPGLGGQPGEGCLLQ
jgi:hypothetical protein